MTAAPPARRLDFASRSLVVVGGLPGPGKTTLLDRLGTVPGVVVLDSAEPMRRWRRLPLPYRLLRPLVHLDGDRARRCVASATPTTCRRLSSTQS